MSIESIDRRARYSSRKCCGYSNRVYDTRRDYEERMYPNCNPDRDRSLRGGRYDRPYPPNYNGYSTGRTRNEFRPPWKRNNNWGFRIGKQLYLYNISRSVNIQNLKNMFRSVGPMSYFSVHLDRQGGISGTGEVCYERQSSVYRALARFQRVDINERQLNIRALSF